MEKKPTSLKLPREEINRRRILESAKELFIEHGVETVNMHQIAKMAGVGQATLYRRYTEKGDICIEVVREECQPLFEEIDSYLDQTSEETALERLYQVIMKFIAFLEKRVPWLCSVSRASSGYRPFQSPLYQWMRITCRRLLQEAVDTGEASAVDVPYTVETLMATLFNIDFHLKDQGFSTEQILQGLQRIFIDGLKN
ncbi:TetR/AcrR family transcriptional regulator [Bacillus atrophaeus]|uniref:TetR/AcrR family transcriptional regulator n=1 Tax=Bacillus atrophaeus TaxID=1452 RepID=UPI00227F83B7|nr:TetR/AcrR family transcriptional regulator [Bacillus atrophaeus]MCY8910784.1 TetR/AcrR family transcriptional regulator [Bacillus atrophaeus]MEC0839170.1 TetR/AcrR family transcriptional regulator [Bacillus atrophaeus]MEC0845131.1 TetR/AcrR family transcriptional regulator [Bacillus atrophaeus]MEC0850198.1 TetR/AcrR family transcriptional regulator [Bacillus atrophaeus]MEC0865550.1 TetR/AcrR family transcriptional regulator [Bacillus atrophaeus]